MDVLLALFAFLLISSFVLQFLLYKTVNEEKKYRIAFVMNFILVLVLSFFAFSSLPNNFALQRIIAIVWPIIATLALILKYRKLESKTLPNTLLTISMAGALIQTLFI